MRSVCVGIALTLSASLACEKDKPSPAAEPATPAAASPGVGVVSANELGPQNRNVVTVSSRSAEAVEEFKRGRELVENVREAEAAERFRRAVELDPDFALAHAYLGFVGAKDESATHFERAIALSSELPEAEALVIRAMQARRNGDRLAEAKIHGELSELKPKDWRVAKWVGDTANRLGKTDDAIAAYERAIELEPNGAETYNALAYIYAYRNELERAAQAAGKYAELKPEQPNPHDSLGEILMMSGRFDEAEAAFRRALSVSPSFTIAWEGVGLTYVYRGKWAEAIDALERARVGATDIGQRVRVARGIAFAHLGAGDVDKALATIDALAVDIASAGATSWTWEPALALADIHLARGKPKHAAKVIDEALAQNDDSKDVPKQRGRRYAMAARVRIDVAMGKLGRAEKTLAAMESLDAKTPNTDARGALHYARGVVALAKGDASAAVIHFEKVGMEDPNYTDAKWRRAAALEKAGKREAAQRVRDEVENAYRRDVRQAFERHRLVGKSG